MVEEALKLGYRHIDTAAMYRNEEDVGAGLRASGVSRDEVFITTKVWSSNLRARDFERSTRDSLANLKLPSVDLLLIHWPTSSVPLKETVGALCKMKREGLAHDPEVPLGVMVETPSAALIADLMDPLNRSARFISASMSSSAQPLGMPARFGFSSLEPSPS